MISFLQLLLALAVLLAAAAAAYALVRRQTSRSRSGGTERQRGGAKRSAVLLVGECGSGKSVLFHRLVDGVGGVATVTSMKENEAPAWRVGESGLSRTLVDLPGHGRLSYLQRQFAPIAGVFVLVVDALTLLRNSRPVAERLYDLLARPERDLVPVVVACNKHDILTAADAAAIRAELLRELNELRSTRAVQPRTAATVGPGGTRSGDDDDDEDDGAALLGVDGEPLTWEQVPTTVEFVECSARTGEGVGGLVDTIATVLAER